MTESRLISEEDLETAGFNNKADAWAFDRGVGTDISGKVRNEAIGISPLDANMGVSAGNILTDNGTAKDWFNELESNTEELLTNVSAIQEAIGVGIPDLMAAVDSVNLAAQETSTNKISVAADTAAVFGMRNEVVSAQVSVSEDRDVVELQSSEVSAKVSLLSEYVGRAETALAGTLGASILGGDYFPGARQYIPQGAVKGPATIVSSGNGGTDGEYDLNWSGGNFSVNPTGKFTISGGIITDIRITGTGLYIGNAISPPVMVFPLATGLTGSPAGSYTTAYIKTAGDYYYTDHLTNPRKVAYFQNQGNVPFEVKPSVDWLDFDYLDNQVAAAKLAVKESLFHKFSIDNKNAYMEIEPSSLYTGVAGSGFVTPPVDPTRLTAKPTCRLLVPDRQAFVESIVVGVYSSAAPLGDMLGIKKIIVHYEGTTKEITTPSVYSFSDTNGNSVSYLGWWIVLRHNEINGNSHVYFEVVPKDSTMQNRVMGPYIFIPSATLYDYDVTVAPSLATVTGSRYQSVSAALTYLRGVSAQHPRIVLTESRNDYDLGAVTAYTGGAGRCIIEATVPVTFSLTSGTAGAMRPRYGNLHIRGSNITFDMRYISNLYLDEGVSTGGPSPVLDGVRFINSGGRAESWSKGPRPVAWLVRGGPWFLECYFSNTSSTCLSATLATQLVRGCFGTTMTGDVVTGANCVINSTFDDLDSSAFKTEIPSLSVQYTGAEATATLSLSGSNDATSRTFTAKVNGASVGTFVVVNNNPAGNYDVADVVAWLNTLPGWTATLIDDTRRATALCLAGSAGGSFTDVNVKSGALTLVTKFDIHPDFYQSPAAGSENVIMVGNVATNQTGQQIFVTTTTKDMLILNNIFHRNPANTAYYSQFQASHSHVVVSHNVWTDQDVWLRDSNGYSPDAYCYFNNNVFASITIMTANTNLKIANNHFMDGATARGTNATVGGSKSSLFINADAGDFNPTGALLTNLKPTSMRYDRLGARRASISAAGALD